MKHPRWLNYALLAAVSIADVVCAPAGRSQGVGVIKLVVPFAPGGPGDTVARVLEQQISKATPGSTVIVENRPGAGSIIGTEVVAHATPDGRTLLMTAPAFLVNPHVRKLDYEPLASFVPVCALVTSPPVVVVNSAAPYHKLSELVDAAHAKPGSLSLASVGPATGTHVLFEMLKRTANIDMTFVPFSGNAPAITALLGGHVQSALVNYSDAAEHLQAGTLRALAAVALTRINPLPDVPTVAELGFGTFVPEQEFGVVAPAKTSEEIVQRLIAVFSNALGTSEVKTKLANLGLFSVDSVCGADFAVHLQRQYDNYGRIIREANMKAE